MNFVQKAAGLHAAGKQRPVVAVQAGALDEGADFKIEFIVYFLGHWFHYRIILIIIIAEFLFKRPKLQKKRFHTISQRIAQGKI
jgi:hypothetical protein